MFWMSLICDKEQQTGLWPSCWWKVFIRCRKFLPEIYCMGTYEGTHSGKAGAKNFGMRPCSLKWRCDALIQHQELNWLVKLHLLCCCLHSPLEKLESEGKSATVALKHGHEIWQVVVRKCMQWEGKKSKSINVIWFLYERSL